MPQVLQVKQLKKDGKFKKDCPKSTELSKKDCQFYTDCLKMNKIDGSRVVCEDCMCFVDGSIVNKEWMEND